MVRVADDDFILPVTDKEASWEDSYREFLSSSSAFCLHSLHWSTPGFQLLMIYWEQSPVTHRLSVESLESSWHWKKTNRCFFWVIRVRKNAKGERHEVRGETSNREQVRMTCGSDVSLEHFSEWVKRMRKNAKEGIRTPELLWDQTLNLAPLTWLGYLRSKSAL